MAKIDRHSEGGPERKIEVPPSWVRETQAESGVRSPRLADRYELGMLVGSGSMGSVYRAHDLELDEVIAVKILRPELASSPGVIELFKREVKLARRVAHPNVARMFDIGRSSDTRFLTMEYVEGPSLVDVIERGRGLAVARVVEISIAIASALDAAHEAQVVHRDLKPENVLLAPGGRVVVTDFGIARAFESMHDAGSEAHGPLGSPAYMSPEQVQGNPADPRSDLYSLGVVMFEALTGSLPFSARSGFALAAERATHPVPEVRKLRPAVPAALASLVERCLERGPARRHASAADLLEDLRRVAAEMGEPSLRPSNPPKASLRSSTPRASSSCPPESGPPESGQHLEGLTRKAEIAFRDGLTLGHGRAAELYAEIARRAPGDPDHLARQAVASLWHWFFGATTGCEAGGSLAMVAVPPDAPRADAEKAIERALSIDPDHLEARYARALLSSFSGDGTAAALEIMSAFELGANAHLHELFGQLLRESGAGMSARRELEAALLLDGEMLVANLELARLSALEGDWAAADRSFARVMHPRDPRCAPQRRRFAARMALWKGDFEGARDIASSGDPSLPGIDRVYRLLQERDPKPDLQRHFDDAEGAHGCAKAVAVMRQFEAEIACGLGDVEWAILAVSRAIEAGLADVMWMDRCPALEPVRRDERSTNLRAVLEARASRLRNAVARTIEVRHSLKEPPT